MQIGVAWAATLIFLTLKLTGVIDWSWWLVFAPIWIGLVIGVIFLTIALLAVFVVDWKFTRKEEKKDE